jgi:hypothetical protein
MSGTTSDPPPAAEGHGPGAEGRGLGTEGDGLSGDERAELERLRAAVAARKTRHRVSWRGPAATLLVLFGCILAPISVLGVWTANQVSDTDRYVANMAPLISQPPIQNALTDKVTDAITSNLDLTGYVNQASQALDSRGFDRVGGLLQAVGPSITGAVTGYIHGTVHSLVTSQRFADTWVQVNRTAHQAVVTALSGGKGAVSTANGQVVIDLAPFIDIVKQNLASRGFTLVERLPPIHPTMSLFSSQKLTQAQTLYRLINNLKIVLPILTLVLIGAGVYVARSRRRALIGAGLGFAASMLVLGVGLQIGRGIYLDSVPQSVLPSDAAAAAYDTLVRFIRDCLRAMLVVGLVVAIAAFFTGPSGTAVTTRRTIVSWFGWLRGLGERRGVSTGRAGAWTYAHRKVLRVAAVALAALIFVFSGQPTPALGIVLAVVLLVLLGLIELIGRPPAAAPVPEPAGHG